MKKHIVNAGKTVYVTASRAPRWFWMIMAAIAILIIVYYWGKRKGKGTAIEIDIPGGAQSIPANWNPNPLIEDLHDVLDSTTFSPWAWDKRDRVFGEFLDIQTDAMFVFINNEYNKRYQPQMKSSLKNQIESEGMLGLWQAKKVKIIERMNELNIV